VEWTAARADSPATNPVKSVVDLAAASAAVVEDEDVVDVADLPLRDAH
jgi:hypothetical protein